MKNFIVASVFLPLVIACGGGGGDESPAGSDSSENTDPPTSTVTVITTETNSDDAQNNEGEEEQTGAEEQEVPRVVIELSHIDARSVVDDGSVIRSGATRSADIKVPDGFSLGSEQRIHLSVKHQYSGKSAYLSVCTDYQQGVDGSFSINYQSCVLRASLAETDYETDITLTNDVKTIAVALWFLDTTVEPVFLDWAVN